MAEKYIKPYYMVGCTIGEHKLLTNLLKVTINSNINSPYQTIKIWLRLDSKDFVIYNMFGKEDLKLNITYMTESENPSETIDLDLIIIKSELPLSQKQTSGPAPTNEDIIVLTCLIKKPYMYMNKVVNLVIGILVVVLSGICTYLLSENNSQHGVLHRRISEEGEINDDQRERIIRIETILEMREHHR